MSTRSEIRLIKNKKVYSCIYHHMDGYPSHIVKDLEMINRVKNHPDMITKNLRNISLDHGTKNPNCSYGNKSTRRQGDVEYSYDIILDREDIPKDVKIFDRKKKKIFEGSIGEAFNKFKRL